MRLLFAIALLLVACSAGAATHTCSSCELAVVQATNNLAVIAHGDTVVIPAGVCDWSANPFYLTNKAVRLTGAGIGQTVIRDSYASAPAMTVHLKAGYTTEIDNIEFQFVSGFPTDRIVVEGINNDNRNINWHHCRFTNYTSMAVFTTETVTGVFHHNQFITCGLIAHVKASYYDGTFGVRDYGNQSMYAPDLFGTTNFVFFEDNYVTNSTSAIDAQAGGRYVWRYNTNSGFVPETHGSEAAERSGRGGEVYNNIFTGNGSQGNAAFFRGGVWLLYNNSYSNWPGGSFFNLVDNRILEHLFPPYGGASGVNPWDTNVSGIYTNGTVSNTGGPLNNVITDFTRTFTVNAYQHLQLVRTSGKAVTALTRSGSTATAHVPSHGFTNNAWVSFWGANEYGWNCIFQTITVTDSDHFTFATSYAYQTPATGTIKCAIGNNFARILSNTATNITFANSLYDAVAPSSLRLTNGDTYEIRKVIGAMDQVGVYGGTNFLTQAYPDVYNTLAGAQSVSACWSWGNTFADTTIAWTTTFAGGGDYNHIIPGKHYTNGVAKPGYTAYTYPHPLASGVVASPAGGTSLAISGKASISGKVTLQ